MVNEVRLIGNLGQDPEIRTTGTGVSIASLNIATNERVKKGDTWTDHTEWHKVTVIGKQAEACGEHLAKGRQVAVAGKLRTKKWQDKNGVDRWTTEILADEVKFLGGAPQNGGGRGPAPAADDDIPY